MRRHYVARLLLWLIALAAGMAGARFQSGFGIDLVAAREASPGAIRIMPLGDSITYGIPDTSYGSYRRMLGMMLARDGYDTTFVGSQQSGAIADPANEGHPGWTIGQIQHGIDSRGWLEEYQPDVVILDIGTNDIIRGGANEAPDHFTALLQDILARLPNAQIVVAQVSGYRSGSQQGPEAYNAALPAIVAAAGQRVSIVDMRPVLSPTDYSDSLHPNDKGYDKMARAWAPAVVAAIQRSLTAPSTRTVVPVQ